MTSPFGCADAIGCNNCEGKEECLDEQRNIYEEKRSNIEATGGEYMKVAKLYYNWHQGDMCEECSYYEVGVIAPNGGTPRKIVEHQCNVEGDKWYYDVYFEVGPRSRIFNPNEAVIEEE